MAMKMIPRIRKTREKIGEMMAVFYKKKMLVSIQSLKERLFEREISDYERL